MNKKGEAKKKKKERKRRSHSISLQPCSFTAPSEWGSTGRNRNCPLMLDLRLRHQDPSKEQIVSPLLMDISGRHYCTYLIDSMASTPAAQPLIFWFQLPQENLHQGSTCLAGPLGTTVTTSSICPHNLRQGVPSWSCSFISGCLILSCLIFHNYLNKFLFFFFFFETYKVVSVFLTVTNIFA